MMQPVLVGHATQVGIARAIKSFLNRNIENVILLAFRSLGWRALCNEQGYCVRWKARRFAERDG